MNQASTTTRRFLHGSVYLKRPIKQDLIHTKRLWEDEETMAFNARWGGTVSFPESEWDAFYDVYCSNRPGYHYFHIHNLDGVVIGEISSHHDDERDGERLNVKVHASARGNHHGQDALEAFLRYLFEDVGVIQVLDNVAPDNEGAKRLLERVGFSQVDTQDEAIWYRLKSTDWHGEIS